MYVIEANIWLDCVLAVIYHGVNGYGLLFDTIT